MKNLFIVAFVFCSSLSFSQNWVNNFDSAKKIAKQENKNIIMIFSGSDWCAPCIRLDKNIWQSQEFKDESKNNWVTMKLNFPRKKANQLPADEEKHNRELAEKYNKEGNFPLVVILNPEGKVLGKLGFKNVSPSEYIKLIKEYE
ncbi:thioredoxin family protein [Flavobacterium haoranii]|uniref:Thioredoxin-related protein n=1 Tax=Flavobacterium haoranii TaxID=683124 RepID=A0A1M6HM06_9FLAO|nr:thioredoxin family protein [Flavobacterium haoranii]SHJ23236.1 Thioredoxin-related protein [Flavobacterium haoranii]